MVFPNPRAALIALSFLILYGCSSVPDFKPSKPIGEASSLSEALKLCAAYQIDGSSDAPRIATIVPWLRCFETVFQKFPAARQNEAFVMFHRALQAKHDGPDPSAVVRDWKELNFVVSRVVMHLAGRTMSPYSDPEREKIELVLPQFGLWLNDTNGFANTISKDEARTQDVLTVKNEVVGEANPFIDFPAKVGAPQRALNDGEKIYCAKLRHYMATVQNARELGQYSRILEEKLSSPNANDAQTRDRVVARFEATKENAKKLQAELQASFATVRAGAPWFQNGHCLQKNL